MVRSGGRAHATELCLAARFLAERLAASVMAEPSRRARSMSRASSRSEALASRSRSKARSMEWEREEESARERKASNRWSICPKADDGGGDDEDAAGCGCGGDKGQGRLLAMDGGGCDGDGAAAVSKSRVSIVGGVEDLRGERVCVFLGGFWRRLI